MAKKPEQKARKEMNRLFRLAGWAVMPLAATNIHAARGVANVQSMGRTA